MPPFDDYFHIIDAAPDTPVPANIYISLSLLLSPEPLNQSGLTATPILVFQLINKVTKNTGIYVLKEITG